MQDLKMYESLPEWSAQTLPAEAREKHETQEGTWALLTVRAGALRFISLSAAGEELSSRILEATSEPQLIAPGAWHRVEPVDEALRCQVSFLCEPSRYLEKKYQLTAPHSEVRALLPSLLTAEGRTVLDLGCGRGRNSFFLAEQGFSVTALDRSEPSISALREIQQAEGVEFPARVYDINEAALAGVLSGGAVDHVICTVVFQFLDPTRVPAIIADMQAVTRPGGLHLIVAPVTSAQLPCPIDFPFVFEPGELRDAYRTWDVLRYDETPGEFHRRDERGVPFKALFATLVARRR